MDKVVNTLLIAYSDLAQNEFWKKEKKMQKLDKNKNKKIINTIGIRID